MGFTIYSVLVTSILRHRNQSCDLAGYFLPLNNNFRDLALSKLVKMVVTYLTLDLTNCFNEIKFLLLIQSLNCVTFAN